MMFMLGVTGGLIMLEPDISAAATIVMLGGILFFLANGELRQIILVIVAACLVGWLVVTVTDTGRERFLDYANGLQDPQNASYHVQRSMEAVVRGGVFGVGIGRGTTKFTGLPVPWTDSIFAVIAEETGLVGSVIVVTLYIALLWRGLSIAQRAPDMFGRLLAGGITIWIAMEAMINIGVMVNLIPSPGMHCL
jgi:cell division protein FtsW